MSRSRKLIPWLCLLLAACERLPGQPPERFKPRTVAPFAVKAQAGVPSVPVVERAGDPCAATAPWGRAWPT